MFSLLIFCSYSSTEAEKRMELNRFNVQCWVDLLIFCSYSSTEAEKKNGTEQFQCCSGFCVDLLAKENNESLKKYQEKSSEWKYYFSQIGI